MILFILKLTFLAVLLAGLCYGIKEGVARVIEGGCKTMSEELMRRDIINMILWTENEEKLKNIHAFVVRYLDYDQEARCYR